MVQGNSQLETVEEEFMILKTNAEICTAWLEPKVEIKMCAARNMGSWHWYCQTQIQIKVSVTIQVIFRNKCASIPRASSGEKGKRY